MELAMIALIFGLTQGEFDAQNEYALRKASAAYLEESGIKDRVSYKLDIWKDKHISKDVQSYGGFAIEVTKIAIEQRVVYKWSF